ncbi:hypothetical protein AB4331_05890 [Vibrio breoganii]
MKELQFKEINISKLGDEELAQFQAHLNHSFEDADHAREERVHDWNQADQYYIGRLPTCPVAGTSGYVEPVIRDAVDSVMPALLGIFCENDAQAVKFRPQSNAIKQAIDTALVDNKINDIFLRDNNGYKVLYDLFQSALVSGDAFAKVFAEESIVEDEFSGEGVPLPILFQLLEEYPDTDPEQFSIDEDEGAFSADKAKLVRVEKNPIVEYVPNGQMFIEPIATCIESARYLCHRIIMTKSELVEMFPEKASREVIDKANVINGLAEAPTSRHQLLVHKQHTSKEDYYISTIDPLETEVYLYEHWLHSSLLEGGKETKMYKAYSVDTEGSCLLGIYEVDCHPFVKADVFPLSDSLYGMGFYHYLKGEQDLLSSLIMHQESNANNANFRRYTAIKGAYDRKSLLDNRPGGVVEIQTAGAVEPFPYHALPTSHLDLYDKVKDIADDTKGNALGEGLQSPSNVAASTMAMAVQNAEMDDKAIAKSLAYSAVRPLFEKLYELIRKLDLDLEPIESEGQGLKGSQLPKRCEFHIDVNTASDNAREIGQKTNIINQAAQFIELNSYLLNEKVIYEWAEDVSKTMGMNNPLPNPADKPEPTPKELALQAKAELQEAEAQTIALETAKLEMQLRAMEIVEKESDIQREKEKVALQYLELEADVNDKNSDRISDEEKHKADAYLKGKDLQLTEKSIDLDAQLTQQLQDGQVAISN